MHCKSSHDIVNSSYRMFSNKSHLISRLLLHFTSELVFNVRLKKLFIKDFYIYSLDISERIAVNGHLNKSNNMSDEEPSKADSLRFVCYWGSWTTYRADVGKFTVDNIDPNMCTHLIYGFAMLSTSNTIQSHDAYIDLPDNYGLSK